MGQSSGFRVSRSGFQKGEIRADPRLPAEALAQAGDSRATA